MTLTITRGEDRLVVRADGTEIATYVFASDAPTFEGPKPYLHPIRALDGGVLTGYRPWDHRWHKGLQFTWTHVSGENFWGGPTYIDGEGYVARDNVGRMRHDDFDALVDAGEEVSFTEQLTWITQAGSEWVAETRTHRFGGVDRERGLWVLDFDTTLRNISGRTLELGSPTTQGRAKAGYTGFFLRMPRAWTGGTVISPGASDPDELMGAVAEWVAFSGRHDDVDGGGTVLSYAGASSAPPPVKWFVRSEPFPVLSPSPSFDEHIHVAPEAEISLSHRYVFGDRIWDAEQTRSIAEELAP